MMYIKITNKNNIEKMVELLNNKGCDELVYNFIDYANKMYDMYSIGNVCITIDDDNDTYTCTCELDYDQTDVEFLKSEV